MKLLTVFGAASGYNSAFIILPSDILIVTTGFIFISTIFPSLNLFVKNQLGIYIPNYVLHGLHIQYLLYTKSILKIRNVLIQCTFLVNFIH